MKKKIFFLFIVSYSCLYTNAQSKDEVTILYLLPFHITESIDNYLLLKSSDAIHQVKQFEMMGFWLGAKLALQEYENMDKRINIIVRDVVTNVHQLYKILEDSALMENVNIIVGPFYGSLFPVAAEYAKNHNVIIVNPFSTRFDFVKENPNLYKLVPPFSSRPETIAKVFLSQSDNYEITLWGDSLITPELQAYKYYFTAHNIPFKELNTLSLPLHPTNTNLIIALFDEPARVIHCVHTLLNNNVQNFMVVVPEKWLSIFELTEDFYNLPHLYYFTNYFVDESKTEVKDFQSDYIFFYEAPAELAAYSYQGYDITRYFIDLYFSDFNADAVQFVPLSYKFQWNQILNGGFENNKTRLIQIKNLELEEVKND